MVPVLQIDDILEVDLDLQQNTLRYSLNGKDLGIAYRNLEDEDYRFAVTMGWKGESVQLLASEYYS